MALLNITAQKQQKVSFSAAASACEKVADWEQVPVGLPGLSSDFWVSGLGVRVWGLGVRVSGLGLRVWGLGFRVQGARVSGSLAVVIFFEVLEPDKRPV